MSEKIAVITDEGLTHLANKIGGNFANKEETEIAISNVESSLSNQIANLSSQIASPFTFKGTVNDLTDLPMTNNVVNDTYFVKNENYRVTWNGITWKQSSLDESAYLDELSEVADMSIQSSLLYLQASNTGGYTTADDFPANKIIDLASNLTEAHIANLPKYGEAAYVITFTYNPSSAYSAQLYIGRYTTASRIKLLSGWTAWRAEANYDEALKYLAITLSDYDSLGKVPENIVTAINFVNTAWTDYPTGAQYGVLLSGRVSANYKIQIVYEYGDHKNLWWRIVNRTTGAVFVAWQRLATSIELDTVLSYVNKLIIGVADYMTEKNITKLSQISENVVMLTTSAIEDAPFANAVFFNMRYSTNYDIQFAFTLSSKQFAYRIINRSTGEPYTSWGTTSMISAQTVLSVGDSICYGSRNGRKGFLGDLYLNRQDASYPSARLSNTRINDGKHFCIYQQLIDFATDIDNVDFHPDIIVADGGINDYGNDVAMGTMPTKPVQNDTEADALDKSTLIGATEYLFYNMIKYYPTAQRFFVLTHRDKTKPWTKNYSGGYTQTEMNEAITQVCKIYGVRVIDVFNESMINTAFSYYISPTPYSSDASVTNLYYVDNDGVHPLALGYKEGYIPLVKEALRIGTHKAV